MKISVNWLREFTDLKLSVDELVKKIGSQLGEVDEVIDVGAKYKNIVVAKVVSCEKHPNADKLNICLIDDGKTTKSVKRNDKGLVQVVCGAPNVRAGLTVAWIPPGAIVPSTYDKEQFKLDVRPLRGVDSNGMIASASELAISDDHSGILVIDKPAKPGTSFAELYELDDYTIDVENKMFTHRPDCFGILGVAREIAGIQGIKFKSPEWYKQSLPLKASRSGKKIPLKIDNKIPELVPRFVAVPLSDVKVKKSPLIMQTYLSRLGVKPINNIVDITNFVMLLTAQPIHAYDADKLNDYKLETRLSKKGEKLTLLGDKTIAFNDNKTILITSDNQPVGVGGVMGGRDSEVDFSTTNIIVECASFDMYSIRRTSMEYGLFTDAVTRFNKGQSDLQNDVVVTYAVGMMQKLADAELAGSVIDTAPDKSIGYWKGFEVTTEFINERLGLELSTSQIASILKNVEIGVSTKGSKLVVSPPFWRTDLEISEDIVEEVGRLYGYDNLPLKLPNRSTQPAPTDRTLDIKQQVRQSLAGAGANEVLTYSFVHGDLLDAVGQDIKQAFRLSNAISPDLQYYRLSLTPSLLDKVHMNIKAGYNEFAIFEIGKTHNKTDKDPSEKSLPFEHERVALVYASKSADNVGASYYQAKGFLDYLAENQNVEVSYLPFANVKYSEDDKAQVSPFNPERSAYILVQMPDNKEAVLGTVGEYKSSVAKKLKLPKTTAGFEIDLYVLSAAIKKSKYRPLSRFPSTHQDISFKVNKDMKFNKLEELVKEELQRAADEHGYSFDLETIDIYQKTAKHITFRITLSHHDRTLVTGEVNKLLDTIAKYAKKKVKAERI